MRDFRIQALIDIWKTVYKGEVSVLTMVWYLSFWFLPRKLESLRSNKFFDLNDFYPLRKLLFDLGKKDLAWFPRLMEPTTLGIRGWEYGHLLFRTKFADKKVLDVGSGSSRLPIFLTKLGAKVTMLDMNRPLEVTKVRLANNLKFVLGDMTKMGFADNLFDVVICISAIEHVDMKAYGYYKSDEYKERALLAIKEMARVLRPEGIFYLTTDFYLKKQKSDNWIYSKDKIHGAFEMKFLKKMIKVMQASGIVFDSRPTNDPKILENNKYRANYRGRYFTTYAFLGKKQITLNKD